MSKSTQTLFALSLLRTLKDEAIPMLIFLTTGERLVSIKYGPRETAEFLCLQMPLPEDFSVSIISDDSTLQGLNEE